MTPIVHRFAVEGRAANLKVNIPSGTVRLTESTDQTVVVEIEGKSADKIDVFAVGDDVTIAFQDEQKGLFFGVSGRITIRVQLPPDSTVQMSTASADLHADVSLGSTKLATASGDARFGQVNGSLEVKSASGDVHVESVAESFRASLASGDVHAGTIGDGLLVNTASGDVDVARAGGDVDLKSASGDLTVDLWTGSRFSAKTVSGNASVGVPAGTRADLNLRSLSGKVRMPDARGAAVPDAERVERSLAFKSVSGNFSLTVE